ncbi:PleD family two-component system response regulator [Streptomyces sp. NPDC056224]|uniref:response regulator n=1 Tax=Streptomyces sp. NPDC056224 TaxID=3345750 RepID=UPI0035D76769
MSSASPDKILLVAKDRTLRTLLERLLVGGGFAVVDGGTGADTVALLESAGPIALVVCERTGPGLDEVALFEEIRRSPGHGRVPILALPPADPECTARALEAGVDDCLAKPFHPKEFLTRVERLARPTARGNTP